MLIGTYLLMCVIHKHTGNLVKLWKNLLSYGKDDITRVVSVATKGVYCISRCGSWFLAIDNINLPSS